MRILWNPNPLATAIELDEDDRRLLRLRLETEHLRDRIGSATLDAPYSVDGEARNGQSLDEHLDARLSEFAAALLDAHCGDCTCVPCGCVKCHAEYLMGTSTTAGLGSHEASHVADAFEPRAPGGPTPSLEEAIQWLADYEPVKGPAWAGYSDAEFERHVPRWIEEAKRAHTWLVAYQREHFDVGRAST